MKTRIISILALLLTMTQGAWADTPTGRFDICTSHPGSIRVYGWAYDPAHPDMQVNIHVYVFPNASCTGGTEVKAKDIGKTNYSRPDINEVHHISDTHGFNYYLDVSNLTAGTTYYIRVFAIDPIDGTGNPSLPLSDSDATHYRTATIQAPYSVNYNANGGSGTPTAQKKCHEINLTLSSTQPTRTGYTFNGWNTNSSGIGTNYASGATYSANAGATLYAK